ncbi:hypothetical protein STEG23_023397 [Scotinomys teguina]
MVKLVRTNLIHKKMMSIEEPPYGVSFHCGKVSHWAKKLPLPRLLTVCCPNWTGRTRKKVTAELCQDKDHTHTLFCSEHASMHYFNITTPFGTKKVPENFQNGYKTLILNAIMSTNSAYTERNWRLCLDRSRCGALLADLQNWAESPVIGAELQGTEEKRETQSGRTLGSSSPHGDAERRQLNGDTVAPREQ